MPAKNATVEEPVKLQTSEEVHRKKSHKHRAKKHHSHRKSHSKMSKQESTELQILNDRDALFNDEVWSQPLYLRIIIDNN